MVYGEGMGAGLNWGVVIAAGGTVLESLEQVIGAKTKGGALVSGRTSLDWMLDAVRASGLSHCCTVGDPSLLSVDYGLLVPETGSAIDNILAGVRALDPSVDAVLTLPSDSPLIEGSHIRYFLEQVERRGPFGEKWFAAGLCLQSDFRRVFPGAESIPLRLKDEPLLAGGFYAASPAGLFHAVDLLQSIRHSRKSQFQMARSLGFLNLVRYFIRGIDLAGAEQLAGRLLGGKAVIVPDCDPCSVMDFDEASEYRSVCAIRAGSG